MRILIAGSGAVGCYFGARLQLAGHQVRFLARGNRRNVLQHKGLHLTVGSDNHRLDVTIADAVENWDIVLLCVKSWQVGDVLGSLPLPSGWRGTVVTTQNGVEAPDQVEAQIGVGQVLAGIVHGFFEMDDGGRVRHVGVAPRLIFNAIAAGSQATARSLAGALDQAGIKGDVPDDIRAALWEKHMLSTALGGVGSVSRATVGEMRREPDLRKMIEHAMHEVVAVAQVHGIHLPTGCVRRNLAFIDQFPADATTSMQRDIMVGRPSEFDAQTGAVMRFAEAGRVDIPVNRFIYNALFLQERRARANAQQSGTARSPTTRKP